MRFLSTKFDCTNKEITMFEVKKEQFSISILAYYVYFDCILKKSFVLSNLILEHYYKKEHIRYLNVQFRS